VAASRDSSTYGEPLYGIAAIAAAQLSLLITTPGANGQTALTNINGELKYTALLYPDNLDPSHAGPGTNTPRPRYADDIVFGGLGNDAIHGGAGDDAISGAEAEPVSYTNNYDVASNLVDINGAACPSGCAPIRSDWNHPLNPGNVLGYNPTPVGQGGAPGSHGNATQFALYDMNDPLRKVMLNADGSACKNADMTTCGFEWLLNFSATEGPQDTEWAAGTSYPNMPTDGNDIAFGDLGNDWLAGGTGRDQLFGGWGDDLLNENDTLDSFGGLNNQPTTNPSYEDLGYGGAGRDVLIANTGGDRLIDWVGEFNSYLVPYAPFGEPTVYRALLPQLHTFLYNLGQSDGADQTQVSCPHKSATFERFGRSLVTQDRYD